MDVNEVVKFLCRFKKSRGWGRVGESGQVGGDQGGSEQRIEVF